MAQPITGQAGRWREAWQQARARRPAPAWLAGFRDEALRELVTRGLPDQHEEAWRYTSLEEFGDRGAALLDTVPGPVTAPPRGTTVVRGWSEGQILLLDGQPLGPTGPLPAGLRVTTLGAADESARVLARTLLTGNGLSPLVAMNTALLSDGLLLQTDRDVPVAAPLLISCLSSGAPVHAQPRLLLDLAPGSSLTLVLCHAGAADGVVNCVTQIRCAPGARLQLVRLQEATVGTLLVETTTVELAADARAELTTVDLGAGLGRHDLTVRLAGPGAEARIDGLFLADGRRHLDNHVCLGHQAPGTRSRQEFRGILADSGRGVFNGRIVVGAGASGADAALTNRNLLLARTAEIDTKPELEINTDDVRCSHGATTGQLDPDALFYLRSRGLDEAGARRLLLTAFAGHVVDAIPDAAIRAHLTGLLEQRLTGGKAVTP